MAVVKIPSLEKAMVSAVEWLRGVKENLDIEDDEQVYKATGAVLKALRDRLPVEEVFHLSAQLPLMLKGVMIEEYDPTDKPVKARSRDEFFDMVNENLEEGILAEDATRAVLRMLYDHISEGQMDIIKNLMPDEVKYLFTDEEIKGDEAELDLDTP